MRIIPKYPKTVMKNPFFAGIVVGYLVSTGFNMAFFVDVLYGTCLFTVGVTYYYYKNKEFNR